MHPWIGLAGTLCWKARRAHGNIIDIGNHFIEFTGGPGNCIGAYLLTDDGQIEAGELERFTPDDIKAARGLLTANVEHAMRLPPPPPPPPVVNAAPNRDTLCVCGYPHDQHAEFFGEPVPNWINNCKRGYDGNPKGCAMCKDGEGCPEPHAFKEAP